MKSPKRLWKLISLMSLSSLFLLSGCDIKTAVLNPQGPVAKSQYNLIMYSIWFMLAIVVIIMALTFYMVFKYREKPSNAGYKPPNTHGNTALEVIWTAIPIIIIIALAIPTVKTIYATEDVPEGYQDKKPLVVNVTSADWKWIFSYPEQGIETVNYVNIPKDRPIKFQLTSTGTMASFWIPELGGQKYTMPNHSMELNLVAEKTGDFIGRNANFNGEGFTHMDFDVESQTEKDFDKWVSDVKGTASKLTKSEYNKIIQPGNVGRMTFTGTHLGWVKNHEQTTSLKEDNASEAKDKNEK